MLFYCLLPFNLSDEMQVQSQGQEDPLEKGTATHSTILVWRNPWTEEPGGLQFMGSKDSDLAYQLNSNSPRERLRIFL